MPTLGKKIAGIANKIGTKFSKDNMTKFGNKIVKGVDLGLREVRDIGNLANKGIGKVISVTDKLRGAPVVGEFAALLGGGATQLKNLVSVGTKGVDKLEKMIDKGIDTSKTVSNAVYSKDPNPLKLKL
jgi:hypothetical protein